MGKKRNSKLFKRKAKFFSKKADQSRSTDDTNHNQKTTKKVVSWQLHEGASRHNRDLVVGFDVGTACSKVVVQDQNIKEAYAVPFEKYGVESNKYLLPTVVFVNDDGEIGLGGGEHEVRNLKVNFMDNPDQEVLKAKDISKTVTARDLLAAYLGLALVEVRSWFVNNKRNDYQHINIEWQLNVGLPSLSYDDQVLLRNFKLAALASWNISLLTDDEVSLPIVKSAIKMAEKQIEENTSEESQGQIHPELITPIPEIIAEVLGYVNSKQRENGMHMLVDVGASTLDVSTFILHKKDEDDVYTILWPDVQPLGAYVLHRQRIDESNKIFLKKIESLECLCDGTTPLPDIHQYLPEPTDDDYKCVMLCDTGFLEECSRKIRSVIRITQERRNPLSEAWSSGLSVFLCGGGSKIELYQSIFPHAEDKLANTTFSGFDMKNLPKPKNLEADDMPPVDYHRVAVAYGLSFSGFDIGKIIPSSEVEDLVWQPVIRDIDQYFVDTELT